MKKSSILIIILVVIILAGGVFWGYKSGFFSKEPIKKVDGMILFWADGCSHCEKVQEFIKNNNVEQKVQFTRLQVPIGGTGVNKETLDNTKVLAQKAEICTISSSDVGIPFFWDGSKCIVGDVDIIKFFQEKIK